MGHSLGSLIGKDVGKSSKEIISYNRPITVSDLLEKNQPNHYDVRTENDPTSILKKYFPNKNDIVIKSESLNPLTEHKSDALGRLDPKQNIGGMLKCCRKRKIPEWERLGITKEDYDVMLENEFNYTLQHPRRKPRPKPINDENLRVAVETTGTGIKKSKNAKLTL